jgi:hypothetical protein
MQKAQGKYRKATVHRLNADGAHFKTGFRACSGRGDWDARRCSPNTVSDAGTRGGDS